MKSQASLELSIAEVCGELDLSPRTVRYYEELGLLPGVGAGARARRRVYGADELQRLRFITRLKALGLSLAEVGELNAVYAIEGGTHAMLSRLDELLARRLCDLDQRIAELTGCATRSRSIATTSPRASPRAPLEEREEGA